jgi:hypothetical protein
MNEMKKNLSIWLSIGYISAVITILSGLFLLLSSCTEEANDHPKPHHSGKQVAVKFSLAPPVKMCQDWAGEEVIFE